MTFISDLQDCASALLEELGEQVTITRVTEGAYDPDTGSVGASTTTTFNVYAHPEDYSKFEVDNSLVRATDVKLITEKHATEEPKVGDTVTLNSTDYRVLNVDRVRAQGDEAIFVLQLRI